MPKLATASAFVETATKCRATAASSPEPGDAPRARGLGVGQRLERLERLRRDDEQRLGRVEVARRLGEVVAVDVRDEPHRQPAIRVGAERVVGHRGTEVGASDADVDDGADPLPGVADPLARADALAERGHAVEHLVHLAHDVDPVHDERALARHAQCDVQHRAVLGDVDVLAAEHGVAALGDPARAGELHEQRHRLVRHPVLRPVGVPACCLAAQPTPAIRIAREELAQVDVAQRRGSAPRARGSSGSPRNRGVMRASPDGLRTRSAWQTACGLRTRPLRAS